MKKFFSSLTLVIAVVLLLSQTALAAAPANISKPSAGIESTTQNYGSSPTQVVTPDRIEGLLTDWSCSIENTGADLFVKGVSTAITAVQELQINLYLQRWDGSQWVDIEEWIFYEYSSRSIVNGGFAAYQTGNFYRVRAAHYATDGSKYDVKYSVSSYIYVP